MRDLLDAHIHQCYLPLLLLLLPFVLKLLFLLDNRLSHLLLKLTFILLCSRTRLPLVIFVFSFFLVFVAVAVVTVKAVWQSDLVLWVLN